MRSRPSKPVAILLLSFLLASTLTLPFIMVAHASPFTVTISSPSTGAVFNRGQVVTITASVSLGGSPLSGATVVANTPASLVPSMIMPETGTPGTYSTQYVVLATDPVGPWSLNVLALKSGVTGSASAMVVVSVSGQVKVTVLSPASNAKFNIGEAVTVKATATLQDGSPLASGAAVSFSKPTAGSVTMGLDLSDPSGKTWAGGYAVLASDVPTDGVSWPLTVTAISYGNTGASVQNVNLFRSVLVGVATFGSAAYAVPKDAFAKGETVYVRAVPSLQDGRVASSGGVFFVISGTSVSSSPISMVFSTPLNAWTGSYTIHSSDQAGSQLVGVSATDAVGNTGNGVHQIVIGTGTVQGILVTITSPLQGSVYNRGETATITATVTIGGNPVTGATVLATTPSGGTIVLTGGTGGTYSAQYTVLATDPAGAWTITVTAIQGGQSGSAQVSAAVSDTLRVTVSTWSSFAFTTPKDTFVRGDTVYVKAEVALQDGTAVSSGLVNFRITGTGVANSAVTMTYSTSQHAWVGSYTLLQSDATGGQVVNVAAVDLNGNHGAGTRVIGIEVPVTTQQPLEAKITFDLQTNDITVKSVCNPGCVAPTTVTMTSASNHDHGGEDDEGDGDNGNGVLRTYTIADSAGHTLILKIQVHGEGNGVKAQLVSIQYGNSKPTAVPANEIAFKFSHHRYGGGILGQSINVNNLVNAEGRFDARHNVTHLHLETQNGDNNDDNGQDLTLNGLWLLDLATSYGSLSVGYFQAG